MEKIFFDANNEEFVVHLENDGFRKSGCVYPISRCVKSGRWDYCSEKDGSCLTKTDGARCLFDFNFCWRGVWEGRIYFKDEEYWCEELETIKLLWDKIESVLKTRIMQEDPAVAAFLASVIKKTKTDSEEDVE